MPPALTIGMATYNDFDGCYFTVQALRLYQGQYQPFSNRKTVAQLIQEGVIEIVIIDNAPGSNHSEMLKGLCASSGAKYVQMPNPTGTSPSRNKVFEVASGEWVFCMDSHVLLIPGAIAALLEFMSKNQNSLDLYQGPMIMDNLEGICTHFNPEWRAEMYGTWGRAWQCPCGKTNFTCVERDNHVVFLEMPQCTQPIGACGKCTKPLPSIGWSGHEAQLTGMGYVSIGASPTDEPFEIPGQGLGLFGCRKAAWLGFVEGATGFGAEELNIHEAYRQAGHKTMCLPFMTWLHKFGRPNGIPYPLDRYQKVRNYVLWHRRLGKPLNDIYQHFVATRLLSPQEWDHILASPEIDAKPAGCGSCGGQTPTFSSPEEIFEHHRGIVRDFNEHMDRLRELANECECVVDISIRQESFITLACSRASRVFSYSNEHTSSTHQLLTLDPEVKRVKLDPRQHLDIPLCDLLFLNTTHTAEQVYKELSLYAPKSSHYIVIHSTTIYGELGEGHSEQTPVPGVLVAIRRYLRENPKWSVVEHTTVQYGLTVLSCRDDDKNQVPGLATKIVNFGKALTEHIADGGKKVTLSILEDRLNICAGCPQRTNNDCAVCGCDLPTKTSWASSVCPLGYWIEVS